MAPTSLTGKMIYNTMARTAYFLILSSLSSQVTSAYEEMYQRTDVGVIELKSISKRIALESTASGNYFRANNGLFRSLFRFISKNEIEMTVPVEAEVNPGKMRFFVGAKDKGKPLASGNGIKIKNIPRTLVLSIGIRGSYSEDKFRTNEKKLLQWLARNGQYEKTAPAYAVYWHGPFVPGFFKRSEVHIPISKKKVHQKEEKPKQQRQE